MVSFQLLPNRFMLTHFMSLLSIYIPWGRAIIGLQLYELFNLVSLICYPVVKVLISINNSDITAMLTSVRITNR